MAEEAQGDNNVIFPEYEDCEKCEALYKLRTQMVWGTGNEKADIVFVAEGPGKDEDINGRPFVGQAGQFLDQFFDQAGIVRNEIYLTNTVLCRATRPHVEDGTLANRPPTSEEVGNCIDRLRREIVAVDPILVVALGATAATALYGKKLSITKARGTPVDISIRTDNDLIISYPMLPVFHPALMLRTRSQEQIGQTVEDLRLAKRVVDRYKERTGP